MLPSPPDLGRFCFLGQYLHEARYPNSKKFYRKLSSITTQTPSLLFIRPGIQPSSTIMAPRLNIPPITRIALIVLVFQSTLCAGIRYRQSSAETDLVPYLALVPQLSLIFPWTFLVATLVENNVFTLAIAVLTLFYGGRYLERAWTSAEFARFLLIVSLIPNLITFGTLVALFAITGDVNWT